MTFSVVLEFIIVIAPGPGRTGTAGILLFYAGYESAVIVSYLTADLEVRSFIIEKGTVPVIVVLVFIHVLDIVYTDIHVSCKNVSDLLSRGNITGPLFYEIAFADLGFKIVNVFVLVDRPVKIETSGH